MRVPRISLPHGLAPRLAAPAAGAAARGLLALYLRGAEPGAGVLLALGSGAFVPDLVGRFEPFVMLLTAAPGLLVLYLLADYVPRRLCADASLALPRVGTRRRWARGRILDLAAAVAVYELLSAALVVAVLASAAAAPTGATVGTALVCALLDGALLVLLAVLVNLLALARDAVVAFAVVAALHAGSLLALSGLPSALAALAAPWVPSARGAGAWHDAVAGALGYGGAAASMSPAASVLVLLALFLLASLALARAVGDADNL